jgi:hypothetical protein
MRMNDAKGHGTPISLPTSKAELLRWVVLAALLNAFFWFVITHV